MDLYEFENMLGIFEGIKCRFTLVTVTPKSGTNIIRQREPHDFHAMNRMNVDHETSMKSILAKYK